MDLTVVDPQLRHGAVELTVRVPPESTASDLVPAVARELGRPVQDLQTLYADGRALSPTAPVGLPPLVEGVVLTFTPDTACASRGSSGLVEVHVVGGPDAGAVLRLLPGRHLVGRAAEASIRIEDPGLSRVHAELEVSAGGVRVRDLRSSNGTWLEGVRVDSTPRDLPRHARLRLGSSTLLVRPSSGLPAAAHPDGEGHLAVNRHPRLQPATATAEIRLPRPPARRDAPRLPLMAALLPLVLAVVMWRVLDSTTMLLFGLVSPVMLLGSWLSDRRQGRTTWAAGVRAHAQALTSAEQALGAALVRERDRRLLQHPDHALLLKTATGPLTRLWERRPVDDDFLCLSVGTGTLPSSTTVVDLALDSGPTTRELHQVPVAVPLPAVGVLGLTGPREETVGVARALLAQVCGWHSPQDVSLRVLCADVAVGRDWAWTAHLPHTRPPVDGECRNLVGLLTAEGDQVRRRVAELSALVARRTGQQQLGRGAWRGAHCVVLLDGAQRLRAVPGVSRLLRDGPGVGVHFVCVDTDTARLPVEAGAVVHVQARHPSRLTVETSAAPAVKDVVPDAVSDRWAHRFARALARLRDATPDAGRPQVPDRARLLDILAPDGPSPEDVAGRWHAQPRSTSALLGVAAAGPYTVDLRRDGPHVLVGGTTGSGKSELLQTLIASLALGNRPDEMVFVLVDYKGGSAFKECALLPHTAGLVTDLDGHLTARALTSLEAELRRRERLLRHLAAKDLEDYQATAGAADTRLPRLLLVIDEFKALAEELPDFLDGLVRIAAVGRSLGIHLVLATQRPGGIVSSDIKANVNLRIALRVRDTVDSTDVIDAPVAQAIPESTPGRAYARSGAQPLVLFQTARVGGRDHEQEVSDVSVSRWSWDTAGDPPPRPPTRGAGGGPTDLAQVVEVTTRAARIAGIARPSSPWLPPLPDLVVADRLLADAWHVPYALADLPRQQAQHPVTWDLENDGHLAVAGASRTGRTSFLRTLAGTIATRLSPDDVHLYAFDGAAGGLLPLSGLPHTGSVVTRDEAARADRLVARLLEETARRQRLMAEHGYGSLAEQRRAALGPAGDDATRPTTGTALPYLVVLVDGWEALVSGWEARDRGRTLDAMFRVLREGQAVGIRAVVAGDRGVLASRVGAAMSEKLVLRLADATDLLMAGIDRAAVPVHQPPGRALRVSDAAEMQLALLDGGAGTAAQTAALEAVGRAGTAARAALGDHVAASARAPFRVDPLPTRVALSTVDEETAATSMARCRDERRHQEEQPRQRRGVVGIGGDHNDVVGSARLGEGANALVAGPPRSGRSTTLHTLTVQLLAAGRPVVVLTARRSPLSDLAGGDHAASVQSGQSAAAEGGGQATTSTDSAAATTATGSAGATTPAAPLALLGPSDDEALAALAAAHPALVAVVDDAELFLDTPVERLLLQIARRAEASGGGVLCAGTTTELASMFRGLTVEVRKHRLGVLLHPGSHADGDLFGIRAPTGGDVVPGRGVFVDGVDVTPVQVAVPA